jgi:protein-S-isoprenylcysteine O-methyltransferase Ste14
MGAAISALRITLLTTISLVLYLGLAIVGEGFSRYFSHPPLIALILVTLALGVAALFTEGHIGSGVREDRSNRWVIVAFAVLGFASAYFPALTDRLDVLTFGGEGVRWVGVAIYTVGGALRLLPVFVLGRRFSGLVAIQPGHRLVTHGVYGVIRHPSYLGLLTIMVGWSLAFRAGVGLVIAALTLPVVIARIRAEERLLGEAFGAEYDGYRARTWRVVPFLY